MATGDDAMLEGGCACGRVRYRLHSAPFDTGYCHCGICRRCSGAPVVVYTTVPLADFELVRGSTRRYRSSDSGERGFCGDCGAAVWMRVADAPEMLDITVATLDTPGAVMPRFHIWEEARIPWFTTADGLPRFERSRREDAHAPGGTRHDAPPPDP